MRDIDFVLLREPSRRVMHAGMHCQTSSASAAFTQMRSNDHATWPVPTMHAMSRFVNQEPLLFLKQILG